MSDEKNAVLTEESYIEKTDSAAGFDKIMKAVSDHQQGIKQEVWPTGFFMLDNALCGGLYGSQLICIGAISSLGKTSFCLQVADQMAEAGKDVLIFSLEMSKEELLAKSISRKAYDLSEPDATDTEAYPIDEDKDEIRFTTRDVLTGNVGESGSKRYEAFTKAIDATKALKDHVRIYVGTNDVNVDKVEEVVRMHCKATGNRPAVIIDYLQILTPSEEATAKRYDIRRSTNDDITRMKVLSREYDIPVLVISAFNRSSYTDPVNMASFRESSGIEYSSDILIGLQYEGMDYQKLSSGKSKSNSLGFETEAVHAARVDKLFEEMREVGQRGESQPIELKLLKNRNGSRETIALHFVPKYNYFYDGDYFPSTSKPNNSSPWDDSNIDDDDVSLPFN